MLLSASSSCRVSFDILLRVSFLENCVWIRALFETGAGNGRGQKSGTEVLGGQALCSGSPLLVVPRQSHTTWCSFSEAVRTTPSVCFWKTLFQQLFISLGCLFCLLSDCLRSVKNAGYLWETVESIPAPTLTVLHLECLGRGGCGSFGARGGAGSGDSGGYLYFGICEWVPYSFKEMKGRWCPHHTIQVCFYLLWRGHAPCPPCRVAECWREQAWALCGVSTSHRPAAGRCRRTACRWWGCVGADPTFSKTWLVHDRGLGRWSGPCWRAPSLLLPHSHSFCTIGSWEKQTPGFWGWLTTFSVSHCTRCFWILEKLQWYRKMKWVTFSFKEQWRIFPFGETLREKLFILFGGDLWVEDHLAFW